MLRKAICRIISVVLQIRKQWQKYYDFSMWWMCKQTEQEFLLYFLTNKHWITKLWPWVNHWTFLNVNFPARRSRGIIAPALWGVGVRVKWSVYVQAQRTVLPCKHQVWLWCPFFLPLALLSHHGEPVHPLQNLSHSSFFFFFTTLVASF